MSSVSEGVFLSALQPNSCTVSTYAVPSDTQIPHGGSYSDETARAKRVQQQVALRLAEKNTLPRRTTSTSTTQYGSSTAAHHSTVSSGNYAPSLPSKYGTSTSAHYSTSDYGAAANMTKYQTYNPNSFSSKSFMYSTTTKPAIRASQHTSSGYSSRSAMDYGTKSQMSRGATGGLMYTQDDMRGMAGMGTIGGGYQGRQTQQYQMSTVMRPLSRVATDVETTSLHSLRLQSQPQQHIAQWIARNGSEGSLGSDPTDTTFQRQEAGYSMSNGYATYSQPYSTNDFGTVARQASMTMPHIAHSFSGSLANSAGNGVHVDEAYVRQSFKGPSQRTINRITQNRQHRFSTSGGSMHGGSSTGGFVIGGRMSRAPSMRSVISVGRGKDVFDGGDFTGSMGNLSGLSALDMPTAVSFLSSDDRQQQALGAAYIQHECYSNKESKKLVKELGGIVPLVELFTSEAQRVQQYSTGAARNLIYENMENKVALIEAQGIPQLMTALKEPDDELQKNITGILWNLSSKDALKEKLAKAILPGLTEDILIPLSGTGEREILEHTESEEDIFFSATGCLRNLSSINKTTRERMRETKGLVDALVGYVQKALDDSRIEQKGMENIACVLRNLSYQLYEEIPPSIQNRLDGPNRNQNTTRGEPIGCFAPHSKKTKESQYKDLSTFTEVAKVPKGIEWLWHPKVIGLYKSILVRCESNPVTREAAAGALQNITAGDKRWPAILSQVALEHERILPVILDKLKTGNDLEMRSVAGFLRNLSRHGKDKNNLASKVVKELVPLLPEDGDQKHPSPDVVLNICGALNNLVSCSEIAARDIAYFNGLTKLMSIKDSGDSPAKEKQAKAAATVLSNMFQYKKLHKDYRQKGFPKEAFTNLGK